MSLSMAGKHSLRYSTTVTSLPKLAKALANSMPMTPAPMMQRVLGTSCMSRSSVEVMQFGPVMPGMGRIFVSEPEAMMMFDAS